MLASAWFLACAGKELFGSVWIFRASREKSKQIYTLHLAATGKKESPIAAIMAQLPA
jgi:hypothetical protein